MTSVALRGHVESATEAVPFAPPVMTNGTQRLMRWAGALVGSVGSVRRLCSALLASGDDEALGELTSSTLNNDGSPLQICVTYGPAGRKVRIIGDPAAGLEPLELRLGLARHALADTLELTRSASMAPLTETMLAHALPLRHGLNQLGAGFFWLAGALDGGAAVYANTRWGAPGERWDAAADWLRAVLPRSGEALSLVSRVRRFATLASVGVEGSGHDNARTKLYWRLDRPATFEEMGLQHAFELSTATALLAGVIGERDVPLAGLVLSTSYHACDGTPADVKVDVCAHCVTRPTDAWIEMLDRFGVPTADIAEGLRDRSCDIALIGIGVTNDDLPRINLYMKAAA